MMNSRKYLLEFGAAMAIYVIVLLYSLSYLRSHPEIEYKLVLAFAPVIPIFLITWTVLRELDRLDEMQKRIQHNAMAVSFGVKSHSQLKLIGLRGLLMPSSEHPGYRDSDRFSGPA